MHNLPYCRDLNCEGEAKVRYSPLDVIQKAEMQRRDIGFSIDDCICPAENGTIARDMVLSARQRYARRTPIGRPELLRRLKHYNELLMRALIRPLDVNTDVSFAAWADKTSYSKAEIERIAADLWAQFSCIMRKDCDVNSFKKRERLPGDIMEFIMSNIEPQKFQLKFGRSINARKNWFKGFSGPIFHLIEEALFSCVDKEFGFCPFIKHVPVSDRTEFITNHLTSPGQVYVQTDHSAFEAHTVREVMDAVELPFYKYMSKNLHGGDIWYRVVHRVMTMTVWSKYRNKVKIMTEPMRYSGEMCTSLGNGWTNYVVMKFLMRTNNVVGRGFVEGDDGIFVLSKVIADDEFRNLGFSVKLEQFSTLGECGFCSLNFGPNGQNVRDPREVLAGFGWSFSDCRHGGVQVCRGLLRSKAFSLAFEMPNCPILSSFAKMVLRCTRGAKLRWDMRDVRYKHQQIYRLYQQGRLPEVEARLSSECTLEQRQFVADHYRILVTDQIELEAYFDSIQEVVSLDHPILDKMFPALWRLYGRRYSYTIYDGVPWAMVQLFLMS